MIIHKEGADLASQLECCVKVVCVNALLDVWWVFVYDEQLQMTRVIMRLDELHEWVEKSNG